MTSQTPARRKAQRVGAVVILVLVLIAVSTVVHLVTVTARFASTGPVVGGNLVATCDKALGVMERIRRTMANHDARLIDETSATAGLGRDTSELQAISRSTSDARLPEALQDVSDAVSAYVTGMVDSSRAADLRAVAVNAVSGFAKICPAQHG